MFRFSFFALAFPLICALPAQARPVSRQMPPFQVDEAPEYIAFRTVDNVIDCKDLGGPLSNVKGGFISEEATIEVDSNVGLQISYKGSDLKSGPNSIPTTFEFAVLGLASLNGTLVSDSGPSGYTSFGKVNQEGSVEFARTMPFTTKKGLKAHVCC